MTDIFVDLGRLFADHQIFLVGGSVRDRLLGKNPKDLDFATSALPEQTRAIVAPWADSVWDGGANFGTIGMTKNGETVEITTFRSDGPGRKPEVEFATNIFEDLKRRDFTINAMAMKVDSMGLVEAHEEIIDPFGGRKALEVGYIDTPRPAELSFSDDPLRMLRAARFSSQLNFNVVTRVRQAMRGLGSKIDGISAERIIAEMDKLLAGQFPEKGLTLLWQSGVLERILPEVEWDWTILVSGDVETRWADLLRNADPLRVERRLRALRCSAERIRTVTDLVAWEQRWAGTNWQTTTDSKVRQVVATAPGVQLQRLVKLLRASDTLLPRAAALVAEEGSPTPPLSGKEVMMATGMRAGPEVGAALQHLWKLTLQDGPMSKEEALSALTAWREEELV